MSSNKLKKVLIIAYYFPPIGGGGVQRTVKFAKYLPEFGWEPIILTVKDVVYRSYDPTPFDEIPGVQVVRTGSLDPFRIGRLASKAVGRFHPEYDETEVLRSFQDLEARALRKTAGTKSGYGYFAAASKYFFVPDVQVAWAPFAWLKALRICRRDDIEAVYTTSPPESVHLVGLAIKRSTGLPWIADFRDVWGGSFWRRGLPFVYRRLNRRLEESVLRNADGLVLNTEPSLEKVSPFRRGQTPTAVITNGFDPSDFEGEPIERPDDEFVIAHFGNFGTGLTAAAVLRAFASAGEENAAFNQGARLYLMGVNSAEDVAEAKRLGIDGKAVFAGYVPHREGVRFCKAADLLLLIMGPTFEAERVPGKFYEYIGSGKPVLAAVPEGEAARLVRSVYGGESVVDPADVVGIAHRFVEEFGRWRKGVTAAAPDVTLISQFDRRRLTSRLAALLDDAVKGKR
jgi:glycosyltransferase involved in cell wall biosynthesis